MKFSTPLLLLTSLLSYVSAEAAPPHTALAARPHARDFAGAVSDGLEDLHLSKRATPAVPAGKDATKLHVWIRVDSRPITYDDRSGANHEGLNELMKDTGGRHKDVVVGNPSKGYWEYGLQFNDKKWQEKPNGDGAAVSEYAGDYIEVKNGQETYQYMGQVKAHQRTLKSIGALAKKEIKGKVYNHKTYNCATFATDLVHTIEVVT